MLKSCLPVMEISHPDLPLSPQHDAVEPETDPSNCPQRWSIIIQWAQASLTDLLYLLSGCTFFCASHSGFINYLIPLWCFSLSLLSLLSQCSSPFVLPSPFLCLFVCLLHPSQPPSSRDWIVSLFNHAGVGVVCRWVNLLMTFSTAHVLAASFCVALWTLPQMGWWHSGFY